MNWNVLRRHRRRPANALCEKPTLETLESRCLLSASWPSYAGNAQHTALSTVPAQHLDGILWQTKVDLNPQYSGNDLLIHYGSPLVTPANTVLVPTKTGAGGGFEVQGLDGVTGLQKWVSSTDYILPPHSWTPSFSPTLAPTGRLYFPGAGGTVYFVNSPDSPNATISGQYAFYGINNYTHAGFDNSVFINTPLTSDTSGDIYFGFQVTGPNPLNLVSGIARLAPDGTGTWVGAGAAAGDASIIKVVQNCAPALSNDSSKLYISVSTGDFSSGDLLELNSTTLATLGVVKLKDAGKPGNPALLPDSGTASPMVGPDGDVYVGVLENPFPYNNDRGWLLHFSSDLTQQKISGAFGWDDTASIVPASMVPSYKGTSSYLVFTKYNNYAGFPTGNGQNKIAVLDPNASFTEPVSGVTTMQEVLTILGPTPDADHPGGVREWCINTAAVDPATDSVFANSEDGKLYRWNLATDSYSQVVTLTSGIGEAYTPTLIGTDGTVFAINNATLFAVGSLVPKLLSIAPPSVLEGSPDQTILVNGAHFQNNSVVEWNGTPLATKFVSSLQLQATVPAADLTAAGNGTVTVFTPSFGVSALGFIIADAPLAAVGIGVSVVENSSSSNPVATFTDSGPPATDGNYRALITWGDGHSSAGLIVANGSGGFTVTGSNAYPSIGSYPITTSIVDAGGASTTATSTADVGDAPLSAAGISFAASQGTTFAGEVATLIDPGAGRPGDFAVQVTWGDGHVSPGSVSSDGRGGYLVNGFNVYGAIGMYTVTVQVTDRGGSTTMATSTARVDRGGPPPIHLADVANGLAQSGEAYGRIIVTVYQTYLHRGPDASGLAYWIGRMESGMTDEALEAGFIGSAEYIQNHGGLGLSWLIGVYQDVLGRTPDSSGASYWLSRLQQGEGPEVVALGFTASAEREAQRVAIDYQNYLGRSALPFEVQNGVSQLLSHSLTNEGLIGAMVGSPEFFQRNFDDPRQFLFAAYLDVLNRVPDPNGYNDWLNLLNSNS
jgi:hypothetical protein